MTALPRRLTPAWRERTRTHVGRRFACGGSRSIARGGLRAADLDLVFCHPDGSPYDPDVVTTRFERRTEECPGVIRIRFHDMRHTHATLLLEDGATEKYVAERLGDSVEMIHETYGHVTPRMRAAAVTRLAARLADPATARDRSVTDSDSAAVGEGVAQ